MSPGSVVTAEHLPSLVASPLPDARLVLVEGRVEVQDGAQAEGIEVTSRLEVFRTAGREPTDDDLDEQAAALSVAVDALGG